MKLAGMSGEKSEYLKDKSNELATNSKTFNTETRIEQLMEVSRVTDPEVI
jgi:hypothetical protein